MGASNLHFHDWERHVALADELVAFGTEGVTYKTLPVIGQPDLRVNPNFLDTGVTGRGRAERNDDEFAMANIDSGATLNMRGGHILLYKFLCTLLQTKPVGVETPALSGKFKHVFNVYGGQPAANIGFSLAEAYKAAAEGEAKKLFGNAAKSIHWATQENDFAKMDIETMALSGDGGLTLASPASAWAFGLQHMHRHLLVAKIEGASITPKPAAIDLTADNGLVPWYGEKQTPSEIVLGVFGITGNFVVTARAIGMPMFADFKNRVNKTLEFGWGTAVDDVGYVRFIFDALYNNHQKVSRNGIQGVQVDFRSSLAETASTATEIDIWHSADLAA